MNKLCPSKTALARLTAMRRLGVAAALVAASISLAAFAGPFIYVGNTGEDTVSKVDASNNTEAARVATWFTAGTNHVPARSPGNTQGGPCPSRIAKDSAGNVYVLDRFFPEYPPIRPPAPPPSYHLPVLLKIAPTAAGPLAQLLDNNPTNNHIDPAEITDTRILWAKEIGTAGTDEGALGRALCTDTTGNLWVGMYHTEQYYHVNAASGAVIGGPVKTPGHKPYGCQVDVNGKLWSTDADHTLAEFDTAATNPVATLHDHTSNGQSYALSLFNDCKSTPAKVTVYLSERRLGKTYIAYDSQAGTFSNPASAVPQFISWSVAVDSKGNIFSGQFGTGRVIKANPTGTSVFDTSTSGPTQSSSNLHGLIIDDNDDVWAVHLDQDRVVKYSSANLTFIGPPVLVGKMPYTYGNSPPAVCSSTTPVGDSTFNEGKSDCAKGTICFDYSVPKLADGTTGTANLTLELYQNGTLVQTLTSGALTTSGTYCFTNFLSALDASVGGFDWKMTASFTATGSTIPPVVIGKTGEGYVSGNNNDCPITTSPGCAQVSGEARCLPNGEYSYKFTVTNKSGAAMSQVLLTSVSRSAFTLAPELSNLTSPLANDQSTTVTTKIGAVKPGQKVCFFVSLLSDNAPCCIVQVCPTLPQCGDAPPVPSPSPTAQRR